MNDKKYTLRYLPVFQDDLMSAVDYISDKLMNRKAALRLIDETEKAILKRLENPLLFQSYNSVKARKHKYYRIIVNNFSVFYVVIDDIMEVRRFIYNGRNLNDII